MKSTTTMAINLGTQAIEAVRELREHPAMRRFVDGFEQATMRHVMGALSATSIEQRALQGAHAQGIFEVWESIKAAFEDIKPSQVKMQPLGPTLGAARGRRTEDANV